MNDTDLRPDLMVPPRRLGALLASRRIAQGVTLGEAALALGSDWGNLDVLEVEAGRRPVSDAQIVTLTSLYGVATTDLVPARSRLVVDMQERSIAAAHRTVELGQGPVSRREVLGRYAAMVCAMRGVKATEPIELRRDDLDVLASVFATTPQQIRIDIETALRVHADRVDPWLRRLRGRVLVPAVGVVVAASAFGTLLLVSGDADAGASVPGGNVQDAPGAEVEIGDAVMQERLPDGTPGPVVVRG